MPELEPEPEPEPEPQHLRLATVTGSTASYCEGPACDSVTFGAGSSASKPVEFNSVLLIPDLLSAKECEQLIADVEQRRRLVDDGGGGADGLSAWSRTTYGENWRGFQRYRIPSLSSATAELVGEILRGRLLPFIARELPTVEDYLWARSISACEEPGCNLQPPAQRHLSSDLSELPYRFAPQEPAINRYTAGGEFPVHRDEQALTLNVLLKSGSFDGGGTAFWRQDVACGGDPQAPSSVTIHPAAGVGVVFNGKVQHAGRAVTAGVRHVLVFSFSITCSQYVSNRSARRGEVAPQQGPLPGTCEHCEEDCEYNVEYI